MRERYVVGDVLVCYHALVHRGAHRDCGRLEVLDLPRDGEERRRMVCVTIERGVILLVGVDEDLGLRLRELPQPDHALAGGYLVSVRLPDLDGAEGEPITVETQEAGEIGEYTLGGLGAQVASPLRPGAYGRLEHQVERKDARLPQALLARRAGELVERRLESRGRERAGVLDAVLRRDVIGAEVLAAVRTLHHLVGELFHVAGCDEDCFGSDGGAFDLVVAFLEDIERSPEILDVPLQHRSERAVIDKTGDRPVYLG
ncbi:MAG: hypothetical protein BWX50_00547 [Euryarchaeota archaeon ADurb.Bin009]|nr:MAG: hypothetical protein BWX50_00547 [Euryarchaeota archaeon ADurb.Bin009]